MIWRYGLGLGLVVLLAAGCATTTAAGRTALREGRPAEAAVQFEKALAEDPGRLDALIGLGISRNTGSARTTRRSRRSATP